MVALGAVNGMCIHNDFELINFKTLGGLGAEKIEIIDEVKVVNFAGHSSL